MVAIRRRVAMGQLKQYSGFVVMNSQFSREMVSAGNCRLLYLAHISDVSTTLSLHQANAKRCPIAGLTCREMATVSKFPHKTVDI